MTDIGVVSTAIISGITGCAGVAVAYGVLKQKVKSVQDALSVAVSELSWLRKGGAGGTTVYTQRIECEQYRGECLAVRTSTFEALQTNLAEHASSIRRLENVFRWMLAEKEKLSLTEINKILSGEDI